MSGSRNGLDEMTADETAEMEAMRTADADAEPHASAPEPQQDAAPEPEAPEEHEDTEPAPKRPGMVPHKALHAEREQRKAAEKALAELRTASAAETAKMNERFGMLQKLVEEATKPPPPAPPAPIEIPDFDADPKGYIQKSFEAMRREVEQSTGLARQIAESNLKQAEQTEQARQQQQAMQALQNWGMAQERALEATDPTFPQAREFLLKHRDAELQALGVTDPAQRHQMVVNDAYAMAAQCAQQGLNFAERVRDIARARGFVPAAPEPAPTAAPAADATARVAAAERGRDMALSLGASGGAPRGSLTPDKLASMNDAEFAATLAKLKTDPGAMRALFGA